MNFKKNIFLQFSVLILVFLVLLSCESNFKEVQKMGFSEFSPSGEADSLNLKYTDSGRIKVVLVSPRMLDYAMVEFPFTEFPEGISLTLFDKNGKRTFVTSDYAVTYKKTELIDLQGNVKIANETGEILETEQLYFDQKHDWFHSEKKFKFTSSKGVSFGEGIDFSKDFKKVNSQRISGELDQSE
jgi:LPS export ABC transporter protein LptC